MFDFPAGGIRHYQRWTNREGWLHPFNRCSAASIALTMSFIFPLSVGAAQDPVPLEDLELPTWSMEIEFTLGSVDGPHDAFASPSPMVFEIGEDRIIVTDFAHRGSPRILVFSNEGEFQHSIGSVGEGPGEFLSPASAGVSGDSILWVSDQRLGRITLFDLEGAVLETRRWERMFGSLGQVEDALIPVEFREDGGFLALTPVVPPPIADELTEPVRRTFTQYRVVVDEDGVPGDTLSEREVTQRGWETPEGGRILFDPAHDLPLSAHKDGFPSVRVHRPFAESRNQGIFEVELLDPDTEEVEVHRSFSYRPQVLPDDVRADLEERKANLPSVSIGNEPVIAVLQIPDVQLAVTSARRAPDGTIWLTREEHGEHLTILVLDEALEPIARVKLPPELAGGRLTLAGEGDSGLDGAWFSAPGEFDIPLLHRVRMVR